jgi:UDP-N-acetylmuramoylalanine--D-glutamate ligase
MRFSDLENQRVAILGTGREGQAVWRQIRRRFPEKQLSMFSESDIDEGFAREFNPEVDKSHSGPLNVTSLKQFDILIRSAGISPYREELQKLRSLGLRFTTASNLWFAENPDAKTICISGTMGKSTTAALIAHLLCHAGVKARLAGNIGKPMLDFESAGTDWWVIELSSYQISDLEARPDIAVLLNLSEEHLDWHQGVENYRVDKLKLAGLVADGCLIVNFTDEELNGRLKNYPNISWFNQPGEWQAGKNGAFRQSGSCDRRMARHKDLAGINPEIVTAPASLPGEHNMQNLAAALTVVEVLGLKIPRLDAALDSFLGLPHRLQLIGEKAGIRYFNDSISTTPVSVAAALQTVGFKDVVLLLGGMDRGLDWAGLTRSLLHQTPHAIIFMPDSGPKIFERFRAAGIQPEAGLHSVPDLKEAVVLAQGLVSEKGCILLSPGAPSFPYFRDYEERGNQFCKFAGFL